MLELYPSLPTMSSPQPALRERRCASSRLASPILGRRFFPRIREV